MTRDTEKDRRALRLLETLLELPADARAGYLREHSDDDQQRARIEAMLRADATDHGLLDGAAEERLAAMAVGAKPHAAPERIGRYRIVDTIGHGGMATVYRAERADADFEQTVALKVMAALPSSEHWYERFLQERQILASLQHSNIAQLYDGGVSDGRPYFAMEFVDGIPITEYCDAHRLTIAERLDLIQPICDAVSYAHRKLIVHRDLKPSNILVNRDGVPKLLDFGIAKLLPEHGTEHTETSLRALTPDYAAPEQFSGDAVTTAVDVYALGGLLYELITGRRPFMAQTGSALDIERQIREQGAPEFAQTAATFSDDQRRDVAASRRMSWPALQRSIRGDLENIVLKALREEPARRYGSVAALAEDLRRYSRGLPVEARADSAGYRLRKFVTRHPLGVPLGIAAALGLLITTGYALYQADQARQAAAVAQLEAARANETRDFLTSIFEYASPDKSLGDRLTARQLLDLGALRVDHELRGQPELRAELSLLLASTYSQLGLYDQALPLAQSALDLRTDGDDPGAVAVAALELARVHRLKGDYPGAEQLLTQTGLQSASDPALASAYLVERGELHREQAEFDDAEQAFEQALSLDTERGAPAADIARDLYRYGTLKFDAGDNEQALGLLRQAGARLVEAGLTETTQYAAIRHDIGVMLIQRGNLDEARNVLSEVLIIRRKMLGERHPDVAVTTKELGGIARLQGDNDEAERRYLQALAINEAMLGSDHPETANNLNSLAVFYRGLGQDDVAIGYARRARAGAVQAYGERHPTVGIMTINIGSMQRMLGDLEAARETIASGVDILLATVGEEHHLAGVAFNALGGVQQDLRDYAQAEANFRRALGIFEATAGPKHPHTVVILNGLASVLIERDQLEQAEQHYRRAIDIAAVALPPDHPNFATVQLGLARLLALRGECESARKIQTQYLSVLTAAGHAERPGVQSAVQALSGCDAPRTTGGTR